MCFACVRHVAGPFARPNMNPAPHHQRLQLSSYAWISGSLHAHKRPLAVVPSPPRAVTQTLSFRLLLSKSAKTLGGVVVARVLILSCVAALFFTPLSSHVGPSCLFGLPAPEKCPRPVWRSSSLGTIRPAPPSLWHQECGPQADSWSSKKLEVEPCGTRGHFGLNTKQPDHNLLHLAQLCRCA